MASTVLGRNIMQNNVGRNKSDGEFHADSPIQPPNRTTRLGEYASFSVRPANEERPSSVSVVPGLGNGTNGWGADIWRSSFKAQTREASKTREPTSFLPSNDVVEGTTGSAALSQPGEADIWGQTRSPWGTLDSSAAPTHTRGVSPAPRTNGQLQPQTLLDSTQAVSQFFGHSRAVSAVGNRPLQGTFDAASGFPAPRNSDGLLNGLQHHARGSDESARALGIETGRSSWADAFDPSPTDDHRSNNEFGPSSAEASRNGSLPPSRHSNEPLQYQQNDDGFPRLSSRPGPSYSGQNGRQYAERQTSQTEDAAYAMLGRLSLEDNGSIDQAVVLRRPSATTNGSLLHESGHTRPSHFDRSQSYDDPFPNGTYTPDGHPSSHYDHVNFVRGSRGAPRYGDRGALTPNSIDFRYPYSSSGGTPAVLQQKDYPRNSRQDLSRFAPNPMALDRRLRGIQQEQQQFMPSPYQQYFASQFRGPYNPYQPMYNFPNNMSFMQGFVPPMSIPPAMHIMPGVEPPTGPRDLDPTTVHSPFLRDFRISSKIRRYELKDIFGYAVELSGDQVGSRFIQQKLETANSDDKAMLFKELLPDAIQLMQDVFGNYVMQKFFEHGDQGQKKVLANRMKGHVANLSTKMYGCRVVQKAMEHVLSDQQVELVKELEKDVMKLLNDQNGNHVLQKAVECVPAEHIQFIVDILVGQINIMAMHAYGCRIVQRMLERCEAPYRNIILQELHACGESLIPDQYGNYVAQHVITHGDLESRNKMTKLVLLNVSEYSKHKYASNVVEKCLVHGTDEQRREIMMRVLAKTDSRETGLYSYLKCGYGNYVIQTLLRTLCDQDYVYFVDNIRPELLKAKRSVPKKQVDSVEELMHRFNRHGSVGTIPLHSPNATSGAPTPFLDGHSPAGAHINGFIPRRDSQPHTAQAISPTGGPISSTPHLSSQHHRKIAPSIHPSRNGMAQLPLPTVDVTSVP